MMQPRRDTGRGLRLPAGACRMFNNGAPRALYGSPGDPMPQIDPILAQRVADLVGRLSVIRSLLPQITDPVLRATFSGELLQIDQLINDLQS